MSGYPAESIHKPEGKLAYKVPAQFYLYSMEGKIDHVDSAE